MANGDKVKPYVVFPGHKGEVQNLKKDAAIENRCYVESTVNGWMNENTTIDWVENVLKTFTFVKRRLFACGSFRAHLVQSVKELIRKTRPCCHSWWSNWTYSSGRRIMEQTYKRSTERNVRRVDG